MRRASVNSEDSMNSVVFKNGNSLAVRLVGDCKLPQGTKVKEYRENNRIIIERVPGWPKSFLDSLGAWDEDIPSPKSHARDPFATQAP